MSARPALPRRKAVLVVEDHPLFIQAIMAVVSGIDPTAAVQGAQTLADALAWLERNGHPDLVLLDLNLPDVSGLEGVTELRRRLPDIPIVVLSATDDADRVGEAEKAGIDCYISKSAKPEKIMALIRHYFSFPAVAPEKGETEQPVQEEARHMALSQRQIEVLREMATGKSNKEIARSLDIAVDTVRAHVVEILARLGVRNRTEAVMIYYSEQHKLTK